MSSKETRDRLAELRAAMAANGLDWYIINGTDAHLSEYVAPYWRTRAFISGFTGSAGTVLVSKDDAWLWTDSRYFIQAASQIEGSGITLMKMDMEGVPTLQTFICNSAGKGDKVGIDASTISIRDFRKDGALYRRHGITLVGCDDLLCGIWKDRPALPRTAIRLVPEAVAGLSSRDKLALIRSRLSAVGADYTLVAMIDDIAWICNMRADDVECNPVFLSFLFIDQERAVLFTDLTRFSSGSLAQASKDFEVRPYEAVYDDLAKLAHGLPYYNDEKVNSRFMDILSCEDEVIGRDISTDLKACKNPVELEGMRRSHLMDGIAFANAFSKVDFSKVDGTYDEIAISNLFACERAKLPGYLGPSFNPISGFGEHGAMCHYSASPESNARIDHDGLLVLDTGSQFEYGMTDLTRTLLFGEATAEQKKDYTLTLKGHLALARARFIHPTRGYQLDVLAKQFMWKEGESFYHGTGHGVGFNLNVHEGPMRISTAPIDVVLEEGMVLSDEPGIYKEGRHGIRIENLLAVQKDIVTEFGQFMCFEVLSLVPYEKRLIDISMLTAEEVGQIDAYHKRVYEELVDKVEPSAVDWLREATRPLAACGDK